MLTTKLIIALALVLLSLTTSCTQNKKSEVSSEKGWKPHPDAKAPEIKIYISVDAAVSMLAQDWGEENVEFIKKNSDITHIDIIEEGGKRLAVLYQPDIIRLVLYDRGVFFTDYIENQTIKFGSLSSTVASGHTPLKKGVRIEEFNFLILKE